MKIGKISPTIWNRSVKKKVHMDQTDGSFSWADVCVCGGHAGIGYYAVLGAAGELAARKIQHIIAAFALHGVARIRRKEVFHVHNGRCR